MAAKPKKTDGEVIEARAKKRWGDAWIAELAGYVGVSTRTVRRWAKGETRVPQPVLKLLAS